MSQNVTDLLFLFADSLKLSLKFFDLLLKCLKPRLSTSLNILFKLFALFLEPFLRALGIKS